MTTRMLSEIHEQPHVLERTIEAFDALPAAALPLAVRRVLFVARGTSAHAAMFARYLYSARFGIDAQLALPSLATNYAPALDLTDTLVVAVSQSGATREILDTVEWARARGAATFGVTNVPSSPLLDLTDAGFVTPAGREFAVPATKSHTSQAIALGLLGAHLVQTPRGEGELGRQITTVPEAARRLIDERASAARIAALIDDASGGSLVVGRGYTHGTALEVGLKLEETCLRPVRALSYADLRHGPFAVLDHSRVVLVVAPNDGPLRDAFGPLIDDIRATGARAILIGGDAALASRADDSIGTDLTLTESWLAPLLAIPGQLIAHELGALRGLDVDSPRNLTKVGITDGHMAPTPGTDEARVMSS